MDEILYVSPHADDVAFSVAAGVAAEVASGRRLRLLTLFDSPKEPSRRSEDEAFAASFGLVLERGAWQDAVGRRGRARLFAPLGRADAALVDQIGAVLQARIDAGCREIVAPLGVGQHIDHQIAQAACARTTGALVRYYEDIPYVLTPYRLARRLHQLGTEGPASDPTLRRGSRFAEAKALGATWRAMPLLQDEYGPVVRRLAAATLAAPAFWRGPRASCALPLVATVREAPGLLDTKLRAIALYPSQWRLFYRSLEDFGRALRRYGRAIGFAGAIERCWQPAVRPTAP